MRAQQQIRNNKRLKIDNKSSSVILLDSSGEIIKLIVEHERERKRKEQTHKMLVWVMKLLGLKIIYVTNLQESNAPSKRN
jgi:hypothetical protein